MTNLESNNILITLRNLFDADITETPIGKGIILDARTAFLVSSLSGSAYLENDIYPFSTRGLLKILSSSLEYKFITGIFDGHKPKYSPITLLEERHYLFEGNKILVPIEIENEKDFRKQIKHNLKSDSNKNILVLKIDKSKKGFGMEPYLEMISSFYFSKNGFITETQVPLDYRTGSPDFIALKNNSIQSKTLLNRIFPDGFNIIELCMIRMFPEKNYLKDINNELIQDEILVGEAKTESSTLKKQIKKYINYNVFDNVIEIHNNNINPEVSESHLFSIKENKVFFKKSSYKNDIDINKRFKFFNWYKNYCKLYLLSNFTFDEINEINHDLFHSELMSDKDLTKIIHFLDIDDLIKRIL